MVSSCGGVWGHSVLMGCNVRHPRAVYRLFNNLYAFTNV